MHEGQLHVSFYHPIKQAFQEYCKTFQEYCMNTEMIGELT